MLYVAVIFAIQRWSTQREVMDIAIQYPNVMRRAGVGGIDTMNIRISVAGDAEHIDAIKLNVRWSVKANQTFPRAKAGAVQVALEHMNAAIDDVAGRSGARAASRQAKAASSPCIGAIADVDAIARGGIGNRAISMLDRRPRSVTATDSRCCSVVTVRPAIGGCGKVTVV